MKSNLIKNVSSTFFDPCSSNFALVRSFKKHSFSEKDISQLVAQLSISNWEIKSEKSLSINRNFEFPNYTYSYSFMSNLASFSDAVDHHPNLYNVYNRVNLCFNTHDWAGVSLKDVLMAYLAVFFVFF